MNNSTARRARLAAFALAPVVALATPALASAATGPADAQQPGYSSTQTSTDARGTTRTTTTTFMSPEGPVYERSTERITPAGTRAHTVRSSNDRREVTDTRTNAKGMTRTQTITCQGGDGQSSYQRTVTRTNPDGAGQKTVTSGNASCAAPVAPAADEAEAPAATSPALDTAAAPLVVINAPGLPVN